MTHLLTCQISAPGGGEAFVSDWLSQIVKHRADPATGGRAGRVLLTVTR